MQGAPPLEYQVSSITKSPLPTPCQYIIHVCKATCPSLQSLSRGLGCLTTSAYAPSNTRHSSEWELGPITAVGSGEERASPASYAYIALAPARIAAEAHLYPERCRRRDRIRMSEMEITWESTSASKQKESGRAREREREKNHIHREDCRK